MRVTKSLAAAELVDEYHREKVVARSNSAGKGAQQCVRVGLDDFADLGHTQVDLVLQHKTHGFDTIRSKRRLLQHRVLDAHRLDDSHEVSSDSGTAGRVGKGDAASRQQRRLELFRRGNVRFGGSGRDGKAADRISQADASSRSEPAGFFRFADQRLAM